MNFIVDLLQQKGLGCRKVLITLKGVNKKEKCLMCV